MFPPTQDVLSLLGLHSTPDAAPNADLIQSASEFMQGLYRSIDDSALPFPTYNTRIHISSKVNATALGLDPAKVEGADVIASFINNGKFNMHSSHSYSVQLFCLLCTQGLNKRNVFIHFIHRNRS